MAKEYQGLSLSQLLVRFFLQLNPIEQKEVLVSVGFNVQTVSGLSEDSRDLVFFAWVKDNNKQSIVYNQVYKMFRNGNN